MAHNVDYLTQIKRQMSHNYIFRVYVTEIQFLNRIDGSVKKNSHTTLQDEFNNQFRASEQRGYCHTACALCF
jgi:hypothetical protein